MIQHRLADLVAAAIADASTELGVVAEIPPIELDRPKVKDFGDFSTNVALALAGRIGMKPRDVAEAIAAKIAADGDPVQKVDVAGPGFINLTLSPAWLHGTLAAIIADGEAFGRAPANGQRAQVEFVSANPTGPLTIGHARNAVIGDALARLLEAAGWSVEREYYFNDTGGQMDRFASSVEARLLQALGREATVPEDGYHGDYIAEIAADILATEGPGLADLPDDERFLRIQAEGSARALAGIKATLARFGVVFDTYFSEHELEAKGEIVAAVERLRGAGFIDDLDGAVWFRATEFGDDKDRVVIRSNGRHTYFGADCAYLIDKFARGYDHLIYVWGADHHGDIARVKGAATALGFAPEAVELLIYQFVAFLRGGEPVKMSKRAGTFVSLDELIDEVGTDAARFHLLQFSSDHAMNFDIDEVARQSMDNPVYYVQYAHARIGELLRKADAVGLKPQTTALNRLTEEAELDLLRELAELPEQISLAADLRAPHRLTHYVRGVAERFHRYYASGAKIVDVADPELSGARLALASATKQIIADVLGLVGVSAPEVMERLGDE